MSNLSDIKNSVRPTLSIGNKKPVWFLRDKLIMWYDQRVTFWKVYCYENDIDPIDGLITEVEKLQRLIKTESQIKKKSVDWKLIMGQDVDLDVLALDWLDSYLYTEV